jgi:acyl-CoA thioesterase-1
MKLLLITLLVPFYIFTYIKNINRSSVPQVNTIYSIGKNKNYERRLEDTLYLQPVIMELQKKWPANRMVNFVFHGHSVPAGYFQTPAINTFQSYPLLSVKRITDSFSTAEINCIRTAIGGENAEQGAKRFDSTVLNHQPDILFIDYALNDRNIGLERSKAAWQYMIEKALTKKIKIVLLTPTPDMQEDIKSIEAPLEKYTSQILALGKQYHIPVIDSYHIFKKLVTGGKNLIDYMAQSNHPNVLGHQLVANEICKLFGFN